MQLLIKIFIDLLSGALFWWGGKDFLSARRDILPPILTLYGLIASGWDWWALTMLGTVAIFHLGYGDKSPLRHIFGDGWGRGVWGLMGGLTLSTWAIICHHSILINNKVFSVPYFHAPVWCNHGPDLLWWIIYLGSCFTLENVLKKLSQSFGDPLICIFSFGSIVWFV